MFVARGRSDTSICRKMFFDDPVAHGEAQPCAASGLRRGKGVQYLMDVSGESRCRVATSSSTCHCGRPADFQYSSGRHGVARIKKSSGKTCCSLLRSAKPVASRRVRAHTLDLRCLHGDGRPGERAVSSTTRLTSTAASASGRYAKNSEVVVTISLARSVCFTSFSMRIAADRPPASAGPASGCSWKSPPAACSPRAQRRPPTGRVT